MIYEASIFILFFGFLYFLGKKKQASFRFLLPFAFCIKLIIGSIFLHYYSQLFGNASVLSDADVFFKDSQELLKVYTINKSDFLKLFFGLDESLKYTYLLNTTHWDSSTDFIINDGRMLIRFHTLVGFMSMGKIAIHLMICNFFSLIGLLLIALYSNKRSEVSLSGCFLILLFAPNLLFWSSTIIKEPFIILGLGLLLYGLHLPLKTKSVLAFVIGAWLIIIIKFYIFFFILFSLLIYLLFHYTSRKTAWISLSLTLTLVTLSLFTQIGHPVVERLSTHQFDFNNMGKGGIHARGDTCIYIINGYELKYVDIQGDSVYVTEIIPGEYLRPGKMHKAIPCTLYPNEKPWVLYDKGRPSASYIEPTLILDDPKQLLKNIPEALSISLFRPFFNDPPHHILKWYSIFDTLLISAFLSFAIWKRRKLNKKDVDILIALLFFAFSFALIIGWVTPVLGAIIRYKIPVQIALLLIGLILIDPKKISIQKLAKKDKSN